MGTSCIIGFDSAWTDSVRARGAVCALVMGNGGAVRFKAPCQASFKEALEIIKGERRACDNCLVALDQPTIVPNKTGIRPVDRVAGSLIGFIGGGVQPANRSRVGMFDEDAPIWHFKRDLGAAEDPEVSRKARHGIFIVEVFPALALPVFEVAFNGYRQGPKYNPARRTFRLDDWDAVIETVARYARSAQIEGVEAWTGELARRRPPRKADQDQLDAVLCALIGYQWRAKPRAESIMIGDLTSGYMISPVDTRVKVRLKTSAAKHRVPVDGVI
jgi:predicted RNase H-like nuclease